MVTLLNNFILCILKGKTTGIIYNNEMDDFSTPGKYLVQFLIIKITNYCTIIIFFEFDTLCVFGMFFCKFYKSNISKFIKNISTYV